MRIGPNNRSDEERVKKYAERWGFALDEETVTAFAEEFCEQDALLTDLEALADGDEPKREYRWADDETDPLGGFITRCSVSMTETGPLAGVDAAVKDNMAVAGVPMTCGSKVLDDHLPRRDATVVARLLNAGATIAGKANMDEFAFGSDRTTMRYRLARNPLDPERQPGGSSAGSGVTVANGDVDAALGTDTGGSVRFPAAWCGLVGVKPTRGLVSHDGFVQFSKLLDNVGVLTRETEMAARVLDIIAGEDPRDEQTRGAPVGDYVGAVREGREADLSAVTIGLAEDLMGKAPEIDERSRAAIERLEDHGATVRPVTIPSYEYVVPAWLALALTEIGAYVRARGQNYWLLTEERPAFVAALDKGLRERSDELGPTVHSTLLYAEHLTATLGDEYYALATRARRRLTKEVRSLFDDVDVLASTGVPMLPPKWGEDFEDVLTAMSNTGPFNVTGHPAISVPCGDVDGLPASLQFVAPEFDEESAFRLASAWERVSNEAGD